MSYQSVNRTPLKPVIKARDDQLVIHVAAYRFRVIVIKAVLC